MSHASSTPTHLCLLHVVMVGWKLVTKIEEEPTHSHLPLIVLVYRNYYIMCPYLTPSLPSVKGQNIRTFTQLPKVILASSPKKGKPYFIAALRGVH